jgi:hypothetical protein
MSWTGSQIFTSEVAQLKCEDCNKYFGDGEQLDKEVEDAPPNPTISADILRTDTVTASGNIYPKIVVEEAIMAIKPHMTMGSVLGGFEPPPEQTAISLRDAATILKTMYFKDDVLVADLEILPTERGELLKTYLRAGGAIQVVPRGVGNTDLNEYGDSVVRDYTIITVDIFKQEEEFDETQD